MSFIYLDTETTGLYPPDDEVVELAIIDDEGKPLINTFIRPVHKTKWDDAERIHGINFDMVEGAPTILDIDDRIKEVVKGKDLIIYNKDYDTRFFTNELDGAASIQCCMKAFSEYKKVWSDYHGSYKWYKLIDAARIAGHIWEGEAHRALADTQATRTVWNFLLSNKAV